MTDAIAICPPKRVTVPAFSRQRRPSSRIGDLSRAVVGENSSKAAQDRCDLRRSVRIDDRRAWPRDGAGGVCDRIAPADRRTRRCAAG